MTAAAAAMGALAQTASDHSIEIAPFGLEVSAHRTIKTIADNGQVPGKLMRLQEGKAVTVEVTNRTASSEVVHWQGLFLPPKVDGAEEEGTPMIPPGGSAHYTFTPQPAGFRWYHTHVLQGKISSGANIGAALAHPGDRSWIIKGILGRQFGWRKSSPLD